MRVLLKPDETVQAAVEAIMREAGKMELSQVVAQFLLRAVIEERYGDRASSLLPSRKGCAREDQDWGAIRVGGFIYCASVAAGSELMAQCQEWLGEGLRPVLLVPWQLVERAKGLADGVGIRDRLDITGIEGLIGQTIINLAVDRRVGVHEVTASVANRYNERVARAGLAPGLSMEWCEPTVCVSRRAPRSGSRPG